MNKKELIKSNFRRCKTKEARKNVYVAWSYDLTCSSQIMLDAMREMGIDEDFNLKEAHE